MADPRAKEVLATLKPRRSLGDRIMARVGFRAWERPRVAVSDRIFKLYRLQDPFDPTSPLDENSVGLGPVSLRLGEKKREPAPHAKPKEEKKAALPKVPAPTGSSASAPAPRAPAPPSAPRPTPPEGGQQPLGYIPKQYNAKTPPSPPAKPSSPPPAPPRPQPPSAKPPGSPSPQRSSGQPMRPQPPPKPTEAKQPISYIPKQYGAKGQTSSSGSAQPPRPTTTPGLFGPKAERPGLVGKLPVRPGLEAPAEPKAPSPAAVKQVAIPSEAPRKAPSPAAPSLPKGALTRSGRLTLGAATVVTAEPGSEEPEVIEVVRVTAPRSAPAPTPAPAPEAAWRVGPAPATPAPSAPAPVAVEPARAAPVEPPPPPPPPKAPPPPVRTPPRPAMPGQKGGDSLDDFFAASAQEGRMRIGKAKAVTGVSAAEEPEKPKRAPVALPKAVLPTDVPKPKPDEG